MANTIITRILHGTPSRFRPIDHGTNQRTSRKTWKNWLFIGLVLVSFLAISWLAIEQQVRLSAWQTPGEFLSQDWWRYPSERKPS